MTPRSLLLCVLVLQSFLCTVWCSPLCNNQCCRFVEGFPVRLKKLRENFSHIRDFYVSKHAALTLHRPSQRAQHHLETSSSPTCGRVVPVGLQEANDNLDTALLDQSVEESFKTAFACQAMNNILGFYLGTVLPTALADETEDTRNLKPHMQSIQQIFDQLKSDVHTCRHYFSCKQPFDITSLNSSYTQMESKGLYKAMGELDLLFNYIETYLASKRHRTHVASA